MKSEGNASSASNIKATGIQDKLNSYRKKVPDVVIVGLLTLLVNMAWKGVSDWLAAQPWHLLWFLCPLLVVAVIAWRVAQGHKELVLRGRFLVFFVTYILVFSLASSSDLLIWNRNLTVFARKLPRNWLVPASWGDWRYRIVQKKAQDPRELIVVTMEEASGQPLEKLRQEIANLIQLAADQRAYGIAFDFYFAKDSKVDSIIQHVVNNADKSKTDVIIGFTLVKANGDIKPSSTASVIEACLPIDQQGHLVGLVETDHVVRLIPLYFRWQKNRPSLSLKVAQSLAEIEGTELKIPADGLLRFIEPKDIIRQVSYKELADPNKRALMRDSWVLVGEKSNTDTFLTPFGWLPGVLIHAYAVHSLRHGHFLSRTAWWSGLLVILLSCYIIFLLASQKASRVKIIGIALLLSALIVTASIFTLIVWLVWFDIVYALAAIWLLVIVLILFRKFTILSTQTTPKK